MNQKMYFGYKTHKKLRNILKSHAPQKIFLITGKQSFGYSGAAKLMGEILNKYEYLRFYNFETNPKIEDIKKGIRLFKKSKCDFIIGVGGGSVLDMAKAISILERQKGDVKELIINGNLLEKRKIPLILIPTTAGTGSESTHFSVVYIGKTKYTLAHNSIIPDYAILDPTFTKKLSAYQTACSGIDALCQAVESFWSVNSTEESRSYSEESIDLILSSIIKAVNNPDGSARIAMLKGSNLSGKAINIAETTAAHSISYPITSYFYIPHGHAVALTLPYFFKFNYDIDSKSLQDKRGLKFVKSTLNKLFNILNVKNASEAEEKFLNIMQKIKLETDFSKLGIDNDGREIIVKKGFNPQRMKNNPRIVSNKDLRNLIKRIQ